jgi:hypothetical protein
MFEKLLVFDLEADYHYGLEPWSVNYKLTAAGFIKYENGNKTGELFSTDFSQIRETIQKANDADFVFVVYNASYEYSVVLAQFGIRLKNVIDVMRLHQHATKRFGKERSLSLGKAVEEHFLTINYKEKYFKYLINKGIAKNEKEAHGKVSELPEVLLQAYNMEDVFFTADLLFTLVDKLDFEGYKWQFDQVFYISDVKRNCEAFIRGVKIDRELAYKGLQEHKEKQEEYYNTFFKKYAEVINKTEMEINRITDIADFEKRKAKAKNPEKLEFKVRAIKSFNLNSGKHKSKLVDILGLECRIFTEKGAYSFNKNHLHQWGELGEDLLRLSKLRKPIEELEKVIAMSSEDGRLHSLVKSGLTSTGRSTSGKGGI